MHFLDPRGLESGYSAELQDAPIGFFSTARELDAAGSGDLADATGGHSFTGNDPVVGLRKVAAESEAYYLLGYAPEGPRTGERKIRVHVNRDGLTVRARSRYFVTPPEVEAKAASQRKARDAAEVALPEARPGRRRFRVATEARRAAGGAAVRDRFEESVEPKPGTPLVLARQWRPPAGVWQARVLVEDAGTGRVGTTVHTFEVPDPNGAPRPRLTLDRRFRSGGIVYCQFAVYGAGREPNGAPQVTARWELRREDQLVRDSEPSLIKPAADGRLARTIGVSLAGAEPGRYTLTLIVEDQATRTSISRTEEFNVD